jgi:type II secretory pathway component PulF
MSDNAIPLNVRRAAARFKRNRADYYGYLASMLESSKGNTKILKLFENDAQRYQGKPRGILTAYWAEVYHNNGAKLAETWQGTLPDDEITIIRVAQGAGDGAIIMALKDISRIATLSDRVKTQSLFTLTAALIGMAVALVMSTVFVVFAADFFQKQYSFIPLSEWGPFGRSYNAHAERVKSYGLYVLLAIAILVALAFWSVSNLIGPVRTWLDRNVAIYRTIRDIKGAMFLSTMSTLTRKRGNVMFTLENSLSTLAQSARSPWFKWRVEEIIAKIQSSGAIGSEAFRTEMISEEMYFYLSDTQEARGFSEGFDETGKYVENTILTNIIKRMAVYRWVLLLGAMLVVLIVIGWQFSVMYEMKGVMMNYYSSR